MSEKMNKILDEQRYSTDALGIDISDVSEGAMLVCETLQNNAAIPFLPGHWVSCF